MKTRHQQGYVYKKSGWWYVRYYDDVMQEDGSTKRVQLAQRIAPVCDQYRSQRAVKPLVQEFLRPLNSGAYGPEGTMTLERFVEKVYLPHVAAQKRPSTYRGYRNLWEEYLKPRCGNLRLREFRTCHGERLLAEIARQKPLSRVVGYFELGQIILHTAKEAQHAGTKAMMDNIFPKVKGCPVKCRSNRPMSKPVGYTTSK